MQSLYTGSKEVALNRVELERRLHDEGIRRDLYSLDGSLPAHYEGLVLDERDGKWIIHHCERGKYGVLHQFSTEAEACARMYELLLKHFHW